MFQFPPPFTDDTEKNIHVIIETPKGSRYKYAWQPEYGMFLLKRTMPVGVTFPHDFGFVPHTLADDGDPLDVLVLSGAPAAVGALMTCRVLGIVEAEQVDEPGADTIRNDRVICAPLYNPEFDAIQTITDLGETWLNDLTRFFNFYRSRTGGSFKLVAHRGPEAALKMIHKAIKAGASPKE